MRIAFCHLIFFFFFFNDTATTEIYTLSLHDALPISRRDRAARAEGAPACERRVSRPRRRDRKSTRLNSSHLVISYAVFCLKKKKKKSDLQYAENKVTNKRGTRTLGHT